MFYYMTRFFDDYLAVKVYGCLLLHYLNPVRAKMNNSVETSEYTSAYERIHGVAFKEENNNGSSLVGLNFKKKPLLGFIGDEHQTQQQGIPFSLLDYIELVDWSGRILRDDKRGAIVSHHPKLLNTLGLDSESWLSLASSFGKDYQGAVGSLEELALFAAHTGKRWMASKNELRRNMH